jgi:hypothetical protein
VGTAGPTARGRTVGRHQRAATYPDLRLDADSHRRPHASAGEKFINADERVVSGRYFQAMEIPLRQGRFLDERDTAGNPRVAIIDGNMAGQFWPGQNPVGKRIQFGLLSKPTWLTIAGVVGRVKQDSLDSTPRIAD